MPSSKTMDGRGEARQSEADQLERPCSFRAAVQVVVALQRLQGGLNPSVSYTERTASRQPTSRWVRRKTSSAKEPEGTSDTSSAPSRSASSNARSLTHSNSFGSRGQKRSELLFHPLPPSHLETQAQPTQAEAAVSQPQTVHITATA